MANKKIIGDLDVQGTIKQNGSPISGVGGEIIDQIEYIEDDGDIIGWKFPKYVLPLRYVSDYKDYTLYFDYVNKKVTAYNTTSGNKLAEIATLQFMTSQVIMRGINDDEDDWIDGTTSVDTLEYMLVNGSGDYDIGINSYDLYHSGGGGGGANLYKHDLSFEMSGDPDITVNMSIITTSSERLNTLDKVRALVTAKPHIFDYAPCTYEDDINSEYITGPIKSVWVSGNNIGIQVFDPNASYHVDEWTLNDNSPYDNVTEL